MFVVASHVIQTLNHDRWLGTLLREWIWAPLGMSSTYFSLEDALQAPEHFAAGYSWRRDDGGGKGGAFERIPYMAVDEVSGAGSVISCVDDYVKWIRMLLREEGPLPREGHAAVKTPRMFSDPGSVLASYGNATEKGKGKKLPYDAPLGYGFGWWVGSYRGHAFWTHSGGMHAYGAEVFFFPGLDFGVVTFGNTAGTSNYVGLFAVWQLVDDRLGVPDEERHDWQAGYVQTLFIVKVSIDGGHDANATIGPTDIGASTREWTPTSPTPSTRLSRTGPRSHRHCLWQRMRALTITRLT